MFVAELYCPLYQCMASLIGLPYAVCGILSLFTGFEVG